MRLLIGVLVLAAAARAGAQGAPARSPAVVDPGMTRDQVVARLGEPLSTRTHDGYTYLFYRNGCEKRCGMNDLVVLDSGRVVDAVFRAPARRYSGTSSSPRMLTEAEAKRAAPPESRGLKVPPAATPKKPAERLRH